MSMSNFGRSMLEKYGWAEGKGLGREEDGIADPIKVNGNFSGIGLGHDIGKEFKNQWWDHVYNKTASNIMVAKSEDGSVKVARKDVQNEKKGLPYASAKSSQYSSFVKAGVLDDVKEEEDMSLNLSYDELFKICGGKTAHKGARHGLTMAAKLARVKQQELDLMAKWMKGSDKHPLEASEDSSIVKKKENDVAPVNSNDFLLHEANPDYEPCSKRRKKEKKKKQNWSEQESGANLEGLPEFFQTETSERNDSRKLHDEVNANVEIASNIVEKKPRKKKKCYVEETGTEAFCNNDTECTLNKTKIVKLCDETVHEEDTSRFGVAEKKSKKKRKRNTPEDEINNFENVPSEFQRNEVSETKLSKKERKLLKKLNKTKESKEKDCIDTFDITIMKKKKSKDLEKENCNGVKKTSENGILMEVKHKSKKQNKSKCETTVELTDPHSLSTTEEGKIYSKKKKKKSNHERREK